MNTEMIYQPEILSFAPDLNGETGAECEIILPDYCPNILRILQTTATATVHTVLPTADRLTVEGSVEYKVLYLAEDGSGMKTVSQQAPFSCNMEAKNGTDGDCSVKAMPRNCAARALNPQKIFVRSAVQISVRFSKSIAVPAFSNADGYEIRPGNRKAARLLCTAEKPLRIADEFDCDSGRSVSTILQNRITFRETEQKILTDKLITKADMIFDLLCTDDENNVFTLRKTVPVSQILDLPDIVPEACCRTEYSLVSLNLIPRDKTAEGTQTIAYDVEINVTGKAYEEITAEWTEDAYSVKKAVECIKQPIATERFLRIDESGSVRETVEIGTCTSLLWSDVRPELKNTVYRKDTDRIVCEGIWECRILMTDTDGTPCATLREIPFTLERPADGCTSPVRNDTELILTDLTWALTDAGHMEIRGTYRWQGLIFGRTAGEAVTQINEKTDRPPCEDTVTLYYATAGQSAWDIAKEHACPYGELVRANQLECDIMNEDRMLVIIAG